MREMNIINRPNEGVKNVGDKNLVLHPGFRGRLVPHFRCGPNLREMLPFILDRTGNPAKPMENFSFKSDRQKLFLRVMRLFQIPARVSL